MNQRQKAIMGHLTSRGKIFKTGLPAYAQTLEQANQILNTLIFETEDEMILAESYASLLINNPSHVVRNKSYCVTSNLTVPELILGNYFSTKDTYSTHPVLVEERMIVETNQILFAIREWSNGHYSMCLQGLHPSISSIAGLLYVLYEIYLREGISIGD